MAVNNGTREIMRITRKEEVKVPFVNPTGEKVYELIGRTDEAGGSTKHSLAYMVIPPKCSSRLHYHPEDEETYYILKGQAKMVIDGKEHTVNPGDTVYISPPESHQIFNIGDTDLEFIAISAPAWQPSHSVFL
jgi:mannose-6-phosphate isomerase-like protein (cupin superfamily)